jgi:hypothetical protein
VGGFDERFRMREDRELGVRLLSAGMRCQFIGGAVAFQKCGKSVRELVRDSVAFAESDFLLMRTHPNTEHEFLRRIREERQWKKFVRRMLVARPEIADLLFAPLCAIGERCYSVALLREVAVRALQIRCGVHWYHRLLAISSDSPPE